MLGTAYSKSKHTPRTNEKKKPEMKTKLPTQRERKTEKQQTIFKSFKILKAASSGEEDDYNLQTNKQKTLWIFAVQEREK